MMEDTTLNPARTSQAAQELQRGGLVREESPAMQTAQAMRMDAAQGVVCPHCGTVNEADAMFCASCGQPIGMTSCPNCGAQVEPDADFCETCHHYIRTDVCSFCGGRLTGQEAYCPDCGSPRGGIVCPVCNTLNDFSFCKQCGTALTEDARELLKELQKTPEYQQMQALAKEIQQLEMIQPVTSERDLLREQKNRQLRERVLNLLAKDRGEQLLIEERPSKRLSKEEYDARREARINQLADLLEQMAQQPQPQPAKVRNYAMACKPQGVRLAWECNFKHALHSSPCGCAKPQMGGKWIMLGKNSKKEIKDDK